MKFSTFLFSAALYVPLFSFAAVCDITTTDVAVGRISKGSEWREWLESGKLLLSESGRLPGAVASLAWRCDAWILALEGEYLDGMRDYDGRTQTGVPVLSTSAITEQYTHMQLEYALADEWSVLGRWSDGRVDRNIASVGNTQGYPEQYAWKVVALGLQWKKRWDAHHLGIALWHGRSTDAAMSLYFPGYDALQFSTGELTQQTLAVQWRMYLDAAWYVQADFRQQATSMAQSANATLTRNGVPLGTVYQPRVTMVDSPLTFSVGYRF